MYGARELFHDKHAQLKSLLFLNFIGTYYFGTICFQVYLYVNIRLRTNEFENCEAPNGITLAAQCFEF